MRRLIAGKTPQSEHVLSAMQRAYADALQSATRAIESHIATIDERAQYEKLKRFAFSKQLPQHSLQQDLLPEAELEQIIRQIYGQRMTI